MSAGRMTAADFDRMLPRLGRVTLDTVMIAFSVLVEGMRQTDAAAQHGVTRQRVSAIVQRFQQVIDNVPPDWQRVEVWLPPALAARVEAIAREAYADAETTNH